MTASGKPGGARFQRAGAGDATRAPEARPQGRRDILKLKPRKVVAAATMVAVLTLIVAGGALRADTGTCGGAGVTLPFTDVAGNPFFCEIAAAFFSGLTHGTTATTYSPADPVPRQQMAAFVSRTLDQSLRRGSRRAALGQFWTPRTLSDGGVVANVNHNPFSITYDGEDLWVGGNDGITRARGSDGRVLQTWTGASGLNSLLVARGRIYAASAGGELFSLHPNQPPGNLTLVTNALGAVPLGMAYDGRRIWTAHQGVGGGAGHVSIVSFTQVGTFISTASQGFVSLTGIVFDGANMWVTDQGDHTLKKLNANGAITQTVNLADMPRGLVFDGTNIWVSILNSNVVQVVRAATGQVIATLSGNGLDTPARAAFDGERVLVVNASGSVSLWKATDLSPLGSFAVGGFNPGNPSGVCSDGISFWVTVPARDQIIRF